jgi:hypothetical protein
MGCCKLASQIPWYPFFSALGPIEGNKVQHLSMTLGGGGADGKVFLKFQP